MTVKNDIDKLEKLGLKIVNLSVEDQAIRIIDQNPIYYDKFKKWWVFNKDKKQWVNADEVDIIGYIKKTYDLFGISENKKRTELLNALKDEARYRKPKPLSQYQIQIGKYIYDIRNNKVIEADYKYQPNIIIDYDIETVEKNDECPFIDKLFTDWVGKEKQVLYDIIAFSMSPKYFLDICFWFVGKGENGKGLFTNIINKIVGFENTTSQDIELLSDPKDRFTKGFLKNKLVCLLGDGNHQLLTHTKGLKTLAGSTDRVRGEIKGGGQIDFFNRAKLIGAYNTLPETNDKTNGFYRRQHITEFKNDFSGMKNPLPDVPEREYTILAWKCFQRLKEIYKSNNITGWGDYEERKDKYERLSNPIGLFIKEECEEDNNNYCFGKTLYKYYNRYAIKKGYNSFKLDEFESRVVNQGFEKRRKDVYYYEDKCWGKKKNIPKEIFDSKPEDEWEISKFNVFFGLKPKKIDKIDKIDRFFKLDPLYRKTNLKNLSILSKVSKNEFIEKWNETQTKLSYEDLLDVGFNEKEIEKLKEKGEIFENPKGFFNKI